MFGWVILRVDGRSMVPVLEDGDYAIARRIAPNSKLNIGDIVQADHPDIGLIVKYVAKVSEDGVRLAGTAIGSIDPQAIGLLPRDRILTRLIWRVSPARVCRLRPTTAG